MILKYGRVASFTRLVVTKFNVVVAPDAAVVSVKLATVGVATVVENASAPAVGSPYVPAEVAPTHTAPLVTAAKPVGTTKLNVAAVAMNTLVDLLPKYQ